MDSLNSYFPKSLKYIDNEYDSKTNLDKAFPGKKIFESECFTPNPNNINELFPINDNNIEKFNKSTNSSTLSSKRIEKYINKDSVGTLDGKYDVSYRGTIRQGFKMVIKDGKARQSDDNTGNRTIFNEVIQTQDVQNKCTAARDQDKTFYIENTYGQGKYECLKKDGNNIIGNHYTATKTFDTEVKYTSLNSMENNNCNDLYTDAVGYWDFTKSLNDISGKIGTMNIRKNAQLIGGKGLKVTNGSYCSTNLGSPSVSIGKSKTLVSWITLDNLDSKAGTPFGLQIDGGGDNSKHQFDSLVWAEKENGKWMHGSDYFNRTRKDTSPVPVMNSLNQNQNVIKLKTYGDSANGGLTYYPQEKKLVIRLPDKKDCGKNSEHSVICNAGLSWAIKSNTLTKIEVSGFKATIEKKNFNLNGQLGYRDRDYKYYNIKDEWNGPYNWMIRAGGRMFTENSTNDPLIVTLYNIKPNDEIVSFDIEAARKNSTKNKPISYKKPLETIGFSKMDKNIGTWNPILKWGVQVRAQRLIIPDLSSSNKQMIVSKQSWDGNNGLLSFFINGKKVDSYNVNPITFPKEKFQAIIGPRLAIGNKIYGNISGIVEKCALFNRALSDEEIKNMYDCGINKSTPRIQSLEKPMMSINSNDCTDCQEEYNELTIDYNNLQKEYNDVLQYKESHNINKNFMDNSLNILKKKIYDDNNQMNANFENFTNQNKIDELINYNKELSEKQKVQKDKINLIKEKESSLEKTNELLKTSTDRNNFKKKIIYTLIALIFLLFILSLSTYIYFIRDFKVNK